MPGLHGSGLTSMNAKAEHSRSGRGAARSAPPPADQQRRKRPPIRKVMPMVWKLMRPRRWLMLLGLVLVGINRLAGLVLPVSTKPFIDEVLRQHHTNKLLPIVEVVVAAAVVQALTSFSLTQLMSKAAQ